MPGVPRLTASERDQLIDRLNRLYGDNGALAFSPATDGVVAGHDLESSGNRSYGRDIYVATRAPFELEPEDRLLGRSIAIGAVEEYPRCQLRCERAGGDVVVALYADGTAISRRLMVPALPGESEYDEGLFAWLGPVESYCTPWSDNDPDHCQVVTVHRLRQFAADYRGESRRDRRRRKRGSEPPPG